MLELPVGAAVHIGGDQRVIAWGQRADDRILRRGPTGKGPPVGALLK